MEEPPAPVGAHPSAAPPPPPPPPKSQKRRLEGEVPLQESSFYKMREIVKEIRPHLLEVLRTVDFRNSKGAHEIREKLKLLIELSQQMKAETVPAAKRMNTGETLSLRSDNGVGKKPQEQVQEPQSLAKPSEGDAFESVSVSATLLAEDGEKPGTHIVGGSSFGWNFITYPSSELFYYGRTKESFRASQATV